MRLRSLVALPLAAALVVASCSSGDDTSEPDTTDTATTTPVDTTVGTANSESFEVVAGEPFPADRCAVNQSVGTVTFLTGFDFAAAASIVDVLVADEAGYYDDVCLDVEIRAGFSSANYPLVASGNAQFASGGSFAEVVNFANGNDAAFLATSVEGRAAIDTLIVKAGEATELSDLAGTTIGVKGKLPPSIDVMLRGAGLVEGTDFDTVLLDGFDPLAHIAIPAIVGLPGWKSNEVGALERADVAVDLFDPIDFGVPGSFGVIFTDAQFAREFPSAAEDFMRATMRGLADAIADPAAAAAVAVDRINAAGNPSFLSPEGETFRWVTEAALVRDATPANTGFGVPDAALLQAELDAYALVDLFGQSASAPTATDYIATDLMDAIYDDTGTVIWPA